MQLVIDIPNGCYEEICKAQFPIQDAYRIVAWIKNGKPLPKGHGRIIDESKIKRTFTWDNGYIDCDAPTLIEGDGGDAE